MNVAVAHDLPSGGALRVLVEWLTRTRHTVTAIYSRDDSADAQLAAALQPQTELVHVPRGGGDLARDELVRLLRSPGAGRRLAHRIDEAGHDVVFCMASQLTQSLDVLPALRTPSLTYAPEPLRSAYEPRALLPTGDDILSRLTQRGVNPLDLARKQLDRRNIRAAPHVVTHSRFTQQLLHQTYGVEAEVVLLGVDAAVFTPAPGGGRERFVLAVGALHPLKGHELIIDAVATLAEPRPPVVVVGDRGNHGAVLEARARAAGVSLQLRQAIPFDELLDLYRRAGVVACGQIREPFGLTPLEAMASGTPVVAVAEGGFLETITPGRTGLLVARDAREMGAAIHRLLESPDAMTAEGRRDVLVRWTWQATAARFDLLLDQAAADGPPSPRRGLRPRSSRR